MSSNNDEIDLIELIKKVASFLFNNKWILISVFVLGSILGFYKTTQDSKKHSNYYQSQFVVHSPFIDDNEIYNIITNLSYNFSQSKINNAAFIASINKIEGSRDVISEVKEPQIKISIETNSSQKIENLIDFIKKEIQSNTNYNLNYNIEEQHYNELLKLLNQQLNILNPENSNSNSTINSKKDSEQLLDYIKLLEKKQSLEKKMISLKNPIECYPIEPLNKLVKVSNTNVLTAFGYGIVLSVLSAMIILFSKFIKLVKA